MSAASAAIALSLLIAGAALGVGLDALLSPAEGAESSIAGVYDHAYRGVVELTVDTHPSAPANGFGPTTTGSQGSGFVYDARGDIVTADHVILGETSISVTLWNGETFPAKLVGTDESTDLAVVRIAAPQKLLHPLALGNSLTLPVGSQIVAIGSPFGLPETVTSGIVSALGRSIDSPDGFTIGGAIQTDAAINHGSSGGPLLDGAGQVVGVVSQIQTETGANVGVAFAVPSAIVSAVVPQLIAHGRALHGYLGIEVVNSASPPGVKIVTVLPGTPARAAGLRPGDVITALGSTSVADESALASVLTPLRPGDRLVVSYLRAHAQHTVTVTLSERPPS